MDMFYVMWGTGSLAEVREYVSYEDMIECVRKHHHQYDRHPVVYFGRKLEFEPAEVVKTWRIKERT